MALVMGGSGADLARGMPEDMAVDSDADLDNFDALWIKMVDALQRGIDGLSLAAPLETSSGAFDGALAILAEAKQQLRPPSSNSTSNSTTNNNNSTTNSNNNSNSENSNNNSSSSKSLYEDFEELSIELSLELLREAFSTRLLPTFWAALLSEDSDERDAPISLAWCRRCSSASAALRAAADSVERQLLSRFGSSSSSACSSSPSASAFSSSGPPRPAAGSSGSGEDSPTRAQRAVQTFRCSLRVALLEGWPKLLTERCLAYLKRIWKFYQSRPLPQQRQEDQEWWWKGRRPATSTLRPARPGDFVKVILSMSTREASGRPTTRRPLDQAQETNPNRGCNEETVQVVGDTRRDEGGDSEEDEVDDLCMDVDEDEEVEAAGLHDEEGSEPILAPDALRRLAQDFMSLGLSLPWQDLVMQFTVQELKEWVETRCGHEYEAKGLLKRLTAWLFQRLLQWLRAAMGLPEVAPQDLTSVSPSMQERERAWLVAARRIILNFFDAFVEVRIREIFDMVRDYPDSTPALMDLRRCLARTGRTAPLVTALRQQLVKRLLIAGARTMDVIRVYVKTIKAMRLVEPRGLLLEAVSSPIRTYLMKRKDTVRCVITALTEESDLQEELQGAGGQPLGASGEHAAELLFGANDMEVSEDESDADKWMPDPMEADPEASSKSRQWRVQDIVSLLVGIYGSKELFIKEYKEMLADRLLATPSYGTERETQNLEMLKLRFGQAALAHCEVMLQDIKDSRRINGNVQSRVKPYSVSRQLPPGGDAAGPPSASKGFSFGNLFRSAASSLAAPSATAEALPGPSTPAHLAASGSGMRGFEPDLDAELGAGAGAASSSRLSLEQMNALVLSQHYWPPALSKGEHPNFKLPDLLEEALTQYGEHYTHVKPKRTVQWKRAHGLVEMTVQLQDRAIPVLVTPVHLAVLSCFTDNDGVIPEESAGADQQATGSSSSPAAPVRLSLQEVSRRLELPEALVRKRLSFWVAKGVLKEVSAGVYEVQESLSSGDVAGTTLDEEGFDSPSRTGRGGDVAGSAELEGCKACVLGMLNNHKSLSLARIHNFLQMIMTDPAYTMSEAELGNFLQKLCAAGTLEFDGQQFSRQQKQVPM